VTKFFLHSFGCRATQADGSILELALEQKGFRRASSACEANLVVLNTCTVTAAADQDARAYVRRVHRENPDAKILVTGCYAQRAPREVAALPGVSWVIGNSHKHLAAEIATQSISRNFIPIQNLAVSSPAFTFVGDIFAHTELTPAPLFPSGEVAGKTRPNLKIQDGCNNRCSFCIIPSVRGPSRSLPLQRVIEETNALVAAGYREIVLSGINLGQWGRDFQPQQRFEDLLGSLLGSTDIERIRISSVEPMDWSDRLIALAAGSSRVAKHAHVPLQSGSDPVLRRMHRRYRPWHYAAKIREIREAMPDAAIGADVMVGFPGETDELFEESRSFIEHLPFTYLHVFTYSSRPGTRSAAMPDQVPVEIGRRRNRVLRQLAAEKNLEFRRSFVGKSLDVITLQSGAQESTEALSDNYLKVRLAGRHQPNRWIKVDVAGIGDDDLMAVVEAGRSALRV
jgi:threonylcarbamoyladenosine tRNA methylthiotransferase MtaB